MLCSVFFRRRISPGPAGFEWRSADEVFAAVDSLRSACELIVLNSWQDSSALGEASWLGKITEYAGSGNSVDLPMDQADAQLVVARLRAGK